MPEIAMNEPALAMLYGPIGCISDAARPAHHQPVGLVSPTVCKVAVRGADPVATARLLCDWAVTIAWGSIAKPCRADAVAELDDLAEFLVQKQSTQ